MLDYPSPSVFAQEVRQRLHKIAGRFPLVIVEGKWDKAALLPFLGDDVQILSADGKEKLLAAYTEIEPRLRDNLVFVMDCDGSTPTSLKGQLDLVLTTNRDVEADLILVLGASRELGVEVFAPRASSLTEALTMMDECLSASTRFSVMLGVSLEAARQLGLPTHYRKPNRSVNRVLQVADLGNGNVVSSHSTFSSLEGVLGLVSHALDWGMADSSKVYELAANWMRQLCTAHAIRGCETCLARTFSNGHHFVGALSVAISHRLGTHVAPAFVGALLRAGSSSRPRTWRVLDRLQIWEDASDLSLLS